MAFFNRRSYVAVRITLTSANINYNVLQLVNAVLAAEAAGIEAVGMARSIVLQADPGIDGAGGNTNDILVGDALVSATRYGYVLSSSGGTFTDRSSINNVDVASVYVRSAGAAQHLLVNIVAG